MIFQLNDKLWFPDPALAEADGLLAVGGDLQPDRLIFAYRHGIFPWYSDETPIMWYSPRKRFVLFPHKIRISKSMHKIISSAHFSITRNECFSEVINACSKINRPGQEGTWITGDMNKAYNKLHNLGMAHSIEVWLGSQLVGGLYGVSVNTIFCGESMFSKVPNASKAALIWLCQTQGYDMIDCQVHTTHLESMGAEFISRKRYFNILNGNI